MPTLIVCPTCLTNQEPVETAGRLRCPECATVLAATSKAVHESEPVISVSALDEPGPNQKKPTGAMTMLRQGLRTEDSTKQSGWLENMMSRRARPPGDPAATAMSKATREALAPPTTPRSQPGSSQRFAAKAPETLPEPVPTPSGKSQVLTHAHQTVPLDRGEISEKRVPILPILTVLVFGTLATVSLLQGRSAWLNFILIATVILLGISMIGALQRQEARKAFWQGFAVFGWGYLAMAFVPWFPHQAGLELPTSRMLVVAHAKVTATPVDPRNSFEIMKAGPVAPVAHSEAETASAEGRSQQTASAFFVAGDVRQFVVVGHCLLALLVALIGSGIARLFYQTNLDLD
jgi:hypothetical protein